MKITVRTFSPEVFNIFINTFLKFYPEEVKNLEVFVDLGEKEDSFESKKKIETYIKMRDYYCYKTETKGYGINLISKKSMPEAFINKNNQYVHMLWSALQFDDVISFDDDIAWINGGFFDYVKKTVPFNNVFGQKNLIQNSLLESIASYVVGTRGIKITEKYFDSDDFRNVKKHQGNDTYKFNLLHPKNTVFICNPKQQGMRFNSVSTDYYYHFGSLSTSLYVIGATK
ncbi:MAG: hypothetical protein DRJ01_11150 [Bacteroidetes bacterium]|nr:MAG: hypothetical protein DRJ01_11150 [Bacteroidota bacterium]